MTNKISKNEYDNLLKSLIQIKSPYFHEEDIMKYVCDWLNENGVPARIHHYADDKITGHHGQNVVGVMDSGKPGPTIFVGGHLDTVMLCENWTKEPYEGIVDGKYMYGVGALDMKSGDAAVMMALSRFSKEKFKSGDFKGKVIYQFASVEEGPFGLGTMFYIKDNIDNIRDGVDFAIITEPSAGFTGVEHPCICLGARGGYNYTIKVRGVSTHAATPEKGVNALVDASAIVSKLSDIAPTIDEKLGASAPCVIRMDGGGAACSVPDYAEVEIFHHTVRGESEATIKDMVEKAIKAANVQSTVEVAFRQTPCEGFSAGFNAYCVEENNEILHVMEKSVEKICGKPANLAYFQSIGDFNHFGGMLNVPTILFGPDGMNFHGSDERVNLDSSLEVAQVLDDFILSVLSI